MAKQSARFRGRWIWERSEEDNCPDCVSRASSGAHLSHYWDALGTAPAHPWCYCLVVPVHGRLGRINVSAEYSSNRNSTFLDNVGVDPLDIQGDVFVSFAPPSGDAGLSKEFFNEVKSSKRKTAKGYDLSRPSEFNRAMRVMGFSIRTTRHGRFYWVRSDKR